MLDKRGGGGRGMHSLECGCSGQAGLCRVAVDTVRQVLAQVCVQCAQGAHVLAIT
jgi:hypothetical protein